MSTAPVLVAYASKHSSTAEIAERIASAMRDAGCDAQARPASEVRDLSGYAAVVLGSAVYAKRWQRDARGFARRHAGALRDMPLWLFSSGPFGAVEEHPTAPGNFVERAMLKNTPPERRDARDWPAIEAWARGVAEQVAAREPAPAR